MAAGMNSICKFCSNLRLSSRQSVLKKIYYRFPVAAFSTLPPPVNESNVYPENIVNLVHSISKLTLLEVSKLNELLKSELNIKDAPMMPMTGMPLAAPAAQEDAPVEEVQTEFTVKLLKFDDKSKVKLIKEIKKVLPDMNLVMAKKFVEGCPQLVKENASKEEAENLKTQLESVGAVIEVD